MNCEFCGSENADGAIRRCCREGLAADQKKAPDEPMALTYSVQAVSALVITDAVKQGLREPFIVKFNVTNDVFQVVVIENRVPETSPLVKPS